MTNKIYNTIRTSISNNIPHINHNVSSTSSNEKILKIKAEEEKNNNEINHKYNTYNKNNVDQNIILSKKLIDKIHILINETKNKKYTLDMYYIKLSNINNIVQSSVIIFSTISAFLQALNSYSYISEEAIFIINLVISTYITLILSISKFFKLAEKKQHIYKLKEQFIEFVNKITLIKDKNISLNKHISLDKANNKVIHDNYNNLYKELLQKYLDLLDDKIRLYIEFEKNITIIRAHHYYKSALNKNVINDKKINELDIIIKKNKLEYDRQCILLDKNEITNEYNKNKFDIENELNDLKDSQNIANKNIKITIVDNQKSINDYFSKPK